MGRLALGVLLLLAGAAQALSLAWPWARGQGDGPLSLVGGYGRPLWWLQILSLAVLARALQTAQRPAQAAGRAMLYATAWLVATFWWLFISMHVYGGLPAPLAVAAVLALAAFLGSYYAVAAWGWHKLRPTSTAGGALLSPPSGCWPNWRVAGCGPAFPGARGLCPRRRAPVGAAALDRRLRHGAVASWLAYWLAALAAGSRADKPFGLHGARPLWRPWFWPGAGCGGFAMPPSMHHRPNGQR